ncbi:MAG: alanine:cation symporter family protein [Planctomycetaceae bacterium]|nr:alanine:cation symporter family protein [Planctomycetaceae bacterium]
MFPTRGFRTLVCLSLFCLCLWGLCTTVLTAQETPPQTDAAAPPTAPVDPVTATEPIPDVAPTATETPTATGTPTVVAIEETPPAPTLFQTIDGWFAEAVGLMFKVLFYQLLQTEQTFAVYEQTATYVRDRDSDDNFVRTTPVNPTTVPADHESAQLELTMPVVQMLSVRGELLPGHVVDGAQRTFKRGKQGSRLVEYVQVKVPYTMPGDGENARVLKHGTKFAAKGDDLTRFHRVEPKRKLLSDTFVLSREELDQLDQLGLLTHVDQPLAGLPAYIQRAWIGGIPLVVAWLALGAVFFTVYMRGFNIWGFRHAVDIVRGKYDNPDEAGEVTHFQALASALSATIGLGNIAGVTIAMAAGGPGAFFWMLICGLFGMTTKFTECTLGQKYRTVKPDGTVLGGPMRYLRAGLEELGLRPLGIVLSFAFTVMCVLASFGGGNMYQANQAGAAMLQMLQQERLDELAAISDEIRQTAASGDALKVEELQQERRDTQQELDDFDGKFKLCYGIILAALVGVVILGGIKRIGQAAEKIVPSMCIIYMLACLYIILLHLPQVPGLVLQIFTEAFYGKAVGGGILGVLVIGVQRAAFSNEAGAGSAAIAHSAAKTEEPVREGCVALLGPFIDTIVVCSMTALVILITGAWDNSEWIVDKGLAGSALTVEAFRAEISWFPYILGVAVTLFAYSTIISWSYYGERCWEMLFGPRSTGIYKALAVIAVFVGTIVNLGSVLDFSDMMILGMAFPNIAGVVLLAPLVRKDLLHYWARYKNNEFKTFK